MLHVMWFRRDLRTGDHPALVRTVDEASGAPILPLFVVVPEPWARLGGPARAYVADSLARLRDDLGALHVRTGDPAATLADLARERGPITVHVTEAHTPRGRERDARVAGALATTGSRSVATGSNYAVAPGTVVKGDGSPYRVFTPFHRAWLEAGRAAPVRRPDRIDVLDLPGDPLPEAERLPSTTLPPAGEQAALARWAAFAEVHLADYGDLRDRADLPATSRLSIPLRWGEIHPRTLLAALDPDRDRRFVAELAWREFYADVLHHARRPLARTCARRSHAWCTTRAPRRRRRPARRGSRGGPGIPLVDAGMRQLLAEGWMHNRVRMIVASFLVKDLHLEWQRGAR